MSQLDTLACPVDPGKVDHKRCLYGAPNPTGRVAISRFVGAAHDPVQNIQEAVGAESDEVERVDDGGYGGLAEQEQLRDDAEGLENLGEDPEELQELGGVRRVV